MISYYPISDRWFNRYMDQKGFYGAQATMEFGKEEDEMCVTPYYYSQLLLEQLLEINTPSRVIDVGCGGGWLTRELAKHNPAIMKIEGMDKHYKLIQTCSYEAHQQNLDISYRIENLETIPSEKYQGHYDLITCHNVLGHVQNAESEITKLLSWLRKDGVLSLIIENPASRGIEASMKEQSISFNEIANNYKNQNLPVEFIDARSKLIARRIKTHDQRMLYSCDDIERWLQSQEKVSFEMRGLSVFMDYIIDPQTHSMDQLALEKVLSKNPSWMPYAYFYHFQIKKM
ncbi:class I SAM-dependent methyltransferase [Chryseomicrobium palamuruense]|uniref:Class I SAM-dependent methyltransferase n=1 Tax=Chryseomicrobium palamuruense TaxID=682973 RepID=A0ABV8UV73_9BACL